MELMLDSANPSRVNQTESMEKYLSPSLTRFLWTDMFIFAISNYMDVNPSEGVVHNPCATHIYLTHSWRIPYRADFQDGSYPGSPNTVPLWALTASPTFDLWAGSVPRNMGQQKSEMNNVSSIQLWKEICNKNMCFCRKHLSLYVHLAWKMILLRILLRILLVKRSLSKFYIRFRGRNKKASAGLARAPRLPSRVLVNTPRRTLLYRIAMENHNF